MFSDETPRMIITKDQDWISVLDTVDNNNFSISKFY